MLLFVIVIVAVHWSTGWISQEFPYFQDQPLKQYYMLNSYGGTKKHQMPQRVP